MTMKTLFPKPQTAQQRRLEGYLQSDGEKGVTVGGWRVLTGSGLTCEQTGRAEEDCRQTSRLSELTVTTRLTAEL